MIEIKEIKTKKDLNLFAKYPLELYKDCPYYVPSLRSDEINTFNPKKNFSLVHNKCKGFLAYKDGVLVGRIAGLINLADNEIRDKKFIRFSRLDCIDDIEVFKALIGAVEDFGRENGMEYIHGPWGFNDTDREGMLTFGFDQKSTYATNYYYPYFSKYMVELGFKDESKWLERRFVIPKESSERIDRLAETLTKRLKVVDVTNTKKPMSYVVKKYGEKWFETYNDAYSHLDGFVPIEEKAKKNVLQQFATIINKRYVSILVDEKGDIAAFGVVLPSICDALIKNKGKLFPLGWIDLLKAIKKPKELEMALIAVKREYKNTGINAIIISKILKNIVADHIEVLESNPMLETNYSIQAQWKNMENEIVKKRQTYIKEI